MTGREIESALLNAISKQPNISIFENHLAIDLITSQKLGYVGRTAASAPMFSIKNIIAWTLFPRR